MWSCNSHASWFLKMIQDCFVKRSLIELIYYFYYSLFLNYVLHRSPIIALAG